LILEKKGSSDIKQIVKIEVDVKNRADAISRSKLLDKVSEKV